MTHDDPAISADGEHPDDRQIFILPHFVSEMGYSCARHWTESSMRFQCGCPRCLDKIGLCLVFNAEDWNDSGDMQDHWRKRIVSVKTAICAVSLIVPGYTACEL